MPEKQNYEVAPGVNYEYVYVTRTDPTKPTLLFLHGFPSSLYCWRHQIQYFSTQGYGCLAPNLMGYGKTYSPLDKNEYRTKSMVAHLTRLLDHLDLDRVIVVGHDWGTRPATRFTLYHPERTLGLVLVSVGYTRPRRFNLDEVLAFLKQTLGYESMGYWEFFNADDAASILESNADSFIDIGYTDDPRLWVTDFAPLGKIRDWLTHGKRTRRASYLTDEDYRVVRRVGHRRYSAEVELVQVSHCRDRLGRREEPQPNHSKARSVHWRREGLRLHPSTLRQSETRHCHVGNRRIGHESLDHGGEAR